MIHLRRDIVLLLLVMAIGVVFGHLQVEALPGLAEHGRYHASDMDDLQLQILGHSARPESYAAGADHPVWYLICGMHQRTTAALGWDGMRSWYATTAILPGVNLMLFLLLARRIGFTRFQSFALTMLLLGSGATITWSVVLETHVLAPTSLLAASLLLTHRGLVPRIWRRSSTSTLATLGVSIAIAASITITNGMLAALTIVPARFVRRPRPIPAIRETARRSPTFVTAGLVATGILAILHTVGWYLWQEPTAQRFLEILGERRLLAYMEGSPWESILALAWIAPPMSEYAGTPPETMLDLKFNLQTLPAYASGLIAVVLTIFSLRFASNRTMFIPLFALFGVLLHAIYGRGESFLFAANYTWATVLAAGLVGRAMLPRSTAWIALNLAVVLLIVNLAIWLHGLDWIVENDHLLTSIKTVD